MIGIEFYEDMLSYIKGHYCSGKRFVASLLALTPFGSYNMGYTAHFVRSNRLTPTSYSPNTLGDIDSWRCDNG